MKIYRLRELREKQGLTQQELADRALLARTTIVRIESGQIGARLPVVRRLARALKVKHTVLIEPSPAPLGPEVSGHTDASPRE